MVCEPIFTIDNLWFFYNLIIEQGFELSFPLKK